MKNRRARAIAATRKQTTSWLPWLAGSALAIGGALIASGALAQDDVIIEDHGYSNFGELKYAADFEHLDYVNPDAPRGGEISISGNNTFDSFNLYATVGVAAALPTIYYETVLTSTADDAYGVYCFLCTTMEYPESRDWVIFNIRDDVTFSDGSPMTAHDVDFSFRLFQEQGISEYRTAVDGYIDTVEVLDDYTIKFTFTEEAPRRDVLGFAGGTPVFSKAWFEETGARLDESSDVPFLGSSPYVLESVDFGRQIIVARNPDYWGYDHPMNIGRNNFDRIRVEYFADRTAAFEGFKSGEFTFRSESSSLIWATGYDFPALNDGWVVRDEIPDGSIGRAQSFVFNLDREKFADPRVREAIRLMFNFEWSNETLFYGLYDRVNSFWENSALEARGVPTEAEIALLQPLVDEGLVDASILTGEPVMAPTSSNRALDRANLRRASELLDEAGWVVGDDGLRAKDGEVLSVEFLEYSPGFDRIVNPYVENLIRLGIDASLNRVDVAQYTELRRTGDFDMVNHGFQMGLEPGNSLRQWYGSETADDSSRNLMRLRSEAVDRLLPAVIEARELEDLTTATHALDRVLRAEGFWVQQWFKAVDTIAYYDMYRYPEGLASANMPNLSGSGVLDFWWYDAEAGAALEEAGAFR